MSVSSILPLVIDYSTSATSGIRLKEVQDGEVVGLEHGGTGVSSLVDLSSILNLSGITGGAIVSPTEPSPAAVGTMWLDTGTDVSSHETIVATTITSGYELQVTDRVLYVNAVSGNITLSGFDASSYSNKVVDVQKIDSSNNTVTITGSGGFSGDSEIVISIQYESVTLHSQEGVWYIL